MVALVRGAMCVLRSILGTCDWTHAQWRGGTRHEYPEVHADMSDEFLDVDVQMWLPMYIWWDRQHQKGKSVPEDHIDEGNIRRFAYVASLAAIERSKRAYYMRLAANHNISEADAFRCIEEWYALKEHLLDEEHKKHQAIEFDVYCQICLDRLNDTILLPCQHEVCNKCFVKLPNSNECPFCRGVIEHVIIHEASDLTGGGTKGDERIGHAFDPPI